MTDERRRTGDTIDIEGGYQHNATHRGRPAQRFWHQVRFDVCLEMLDPQSGMTVLDVGCGSGVFSDRIAEVPGTTVKAIDGNPAAIEFASAQYQRDNLSFQLGMVDELDLPSSSFERIAFLEVIEHIYPEQAAAVLDRFAQLLKPGGRLVVSTPNMRSTWPLVEWTMDRLHLAPTMEGEQHVAGYHPKSLAQLCARHGFRLHGSRTLFVASVWLAPLSRSLANAVHGFEQATRMPFGNLLVQSYEVAS